MAGCSGSAHKKEDLLLVKTQKLQAPCMELALIQNFPLMEGVSHRRETSNQGHLLIADSSIVKGHGSEKSDGVKRTSLAVRNGSGKQELQTVTSRVSSPFSFGAIGSCCGLISSIGGSDYVF